ncbi:MAG: hypothetical protein IJ094_09860 [Bacilli bacterium]|nr:hypothetical protein [Bacilli bacterium]
MIISNSVSFILCSLIYSILLMCIYFSRYGKEKKLVHKIFSGMSVSVFICLILEISNYFSVLNMKTYPILNMIISKSYLVGLMTWDSLFVIYIYVISNKYEDLELGAFFKKSISKAFMVFYVIIVVLMITLPIEFSSKVGKVYSYGIVVNAAFAITEVMAAFCIFQMLKNIKQIGSKKYAPFFMFVAGGIFVMLIQSKYPQMLLLTSLDMFITFLTFFQIQHIKFDKNN